MEKWNPENWLDSTMLEGYLGTEEITIPAARKLLEQCGLVEPSVPLSSCTGIVDTKPPLRGNQEKQEGGRAERKEFMVLDNGAGLGQVTKVLVDDYTTTSRTCKTAGEVTIIAGEIDESLLKELERRKWRENWGMVQVERLDAMAIDKPDNSFNYVLTNFLYFLLSDPIKGLQESIRVLKPNGVLGFTTWSFSGPFHLLQHAVSLSEDYPLVPSPPPGQWGHPRFIRNLLSNTNPNDDPSQSQSQLKLKLDGCKLEEITIKPFEYFQYANSPAEMAKKMHIVVKLITAKWGEERKELGWKIFGKIEELLKREQGDGVVKIKSVALVVTARKVLI